MHILSDMQSTSWLRQQLPLLDLVLPNAQQALPNTDCAKLWLTCGQEKYDAYMVLNQFQERTDIHVNESKSSHYLSFHTRISTRINKDPARCGMF